jgi:hypothetical protein
MTPAIKASMGGDRMAVRLGGGGAAGAVGGRGRRAKPNERRKEAERLEIDRSHGGRGRRRKTGSTTLTMRQVARSPNTRQLTRSP